MVNNWLINSLSWLLHTPCILCGEITNPADHGLCSACLHDLPRMPTVCPRCANPVAETGGLLSTPLCGKCQKLPPAFDRVVSLLQYSRPVDRLIQDLKFNGRLSNARLLGRLMAELLASSGCLTRGVDCLIPVPLHPARLRSRGFNQSLELARPVSARLGIPIDSRSCQRIRNTQSQSALAWSERQNNVKNAFIVSELAVYQHVAIIDDVMTSGNTVNSLSMALKQAGVREVSVWCCSRAHQDF